MLQNKVTSDPTAIEVLFCQQFEALPVHPMDDELGGIMIKMLFAGKGGPSIPEKEKPFLLKMIEKRIEVVLTVKITDIRLLLFLCALTITPGKAVMYLTYLQYWANKRKIEEITFDLFCERIFPSGFPSDQDLDVLWQKQKVNTEGRGSDNLLDQFTAMESIQFQNVTT